MELMLEAPRELEARALEPLKPWEPPPQALVPERLLLDGIEREPMRSPPPPELVA
jgi:hypothetical protein